MDRKQMYKIFYENQLKKYVLPYFLFALIY